VNKSIASESACVVSDGFRYNRLNDELPCALVPKLSVALLVDRRKFREGNLVFMA